jgi:hypothetical protein
MNMFTPQNSIFGPMNESDIKYAIWIQGHSNQVDSFEIAETWIEAKLYLFADQTLMMEQACEGYLYDEVFEQLVNKAKVEGIDIHEENTAVFTPSGKDRIRGIERLETFPLFRAD